ncbi:MAG: penicillin-binding protein activator [Pseudomonadota bacterium]
MAMMFANFTAGWANYASGRRIRLGLALSAVVALAGCQTPTGGLEGAGTSGSAGENVNASRTGDLPDAKGEIVGTGAVRVALLVPTTGASNASTIATEFKNAAKMALADIGQDRIQLVIKDTRGQSGRSSTLTREAIREGSQLIIGPLLSASVASAAGVAQPAGVPLLAFTADTSVAKRGIYLNSFPPQIDTRRVLNYAAAQGKKSIVAVLPNDAYGITVEAELRRTAQARGMQVLAVGKYTPRGASATVQAGINRAVLSVAAQVPNADSLFVPYQPSFAAAVMAAFNANGVSTTSKQLLGSGLWYADRAQRNSLNGGWFAERNRAEFQAFVDRYQALYGAVPSFNAGLGYDAVSLAVGLSAAFGAEAFTPARLENANGFSGVTGLFRFNAQGRPERGLAIYEYTGAEPRVLSSAPTSFAGR